MTGKACSVFSTNGWQIFRSESLPSTMASEIDSFVRKFKTLFQAGRNASLSLSSNAGKAVMNLRLDLGVFDSLPRPPLIKSEMDPHNNDDMLLISLLLNKQKPVYCLEKKV